MSYDLKIAVKRPIDIGLLKERICESFEWLCRNRYPFEISFERLRRGCVADPETVVGDKPGTLLVKSDGVMIELVIVDIGSDDPNGTPPYSLVAAICVRSRADPIAFVLASAIAITMAMHNESSIIDDAGIWIGTYEMSGESFRRVLAIDSVTVVPFKDAVEKCCLNMHAVRVRNEKRREMWSSPGRRKKDITERH